MRYFFAENGVLKERPRKVIMFFKGRLRSNGSRYMRCNQLASFVNKYYGERYDVVVEPLARPNQKPAKWKRQKKAAKHATVIFLKGSMDILDDAEKEEIREISRCVGIDHVDHFSGGDVFQTADLHIAASLESHNFMKNKCTRIARRDGFEMPSIALVDHHADERIVPEPQPNTNDLSLVYLGDPENTVIPDSIKPRMLELAGSDGTSFDSALKNLGRAHMHYCIRARATLRQPKPFTKGFTAAKADRNLICGRDVPDATRFLGEDYPFLSPTEETHDIEETVRYAESEMGTTVWLNALERVRAMRERVRPQNVAGQLVQALDAFY